MATHIHKKFTNEQVKELLMKYLNKEIERKYIEQILGVKKAMFFRLLQSYRSSPDQFSIEYKRSGKTRAGTSISSTRLLFYDPANKGRDDPHLMIKIFPA